MTAPSDHLYERIPGGTVEAVQWTGLNAEEIGAWTSSSEVDAGFHLKHDQAELYVAANKAWLDLEVGEWIAKDSLGFYPIKDEVFQKSWRKAVAPVPPFDTAVLSDGELLALVGVDGLKWAQEFEKRVPLVVDPLDPAPGGFLHGWFANAIEAGISEGYSRARRTQEHGND